MEVNNIKPVYFLLFLALFLGVLIGKLPLLSAQSQIDPAHLQSDYDPSATSGVFNNLSIAVPSLSPQVLGETISLPSSDSKQILVDLSLQQLSGYQNGQKVFEFPISSGTYNRTPNGTFYIWTKIKSQKMSGGSRELGTYYYLPNVPNILFFYNENTPKNKGFSIHGAYWHNNFGVPMSHGCLNMSIPDSLEVYNWAEVDTPIVIFGRYTGKKS